MRWCLQDLARIGRPRVNSALNGPDFWLLTPQAGETGQTKQAQETPGEAVIILRLQPGECSGEQQEQDHELVCYGVVRSRLLHRYGVVKTRPSNAGPELTRELQETEQAHAEAEVAVLRAVQSQTKAEAV